jgi:hypothetical protein
LIHLKGEDELISCKNVDRLEKRYKERYGLILMDPCIVDESVEITTRRSFVVEFIIPKFFKSSVPTQPWQRPVTLWAYKPEAANTV